MKLHLLSPLLEGFKEKKAVFLAAGADPAAVDQAIAQFKTLKTRGLLQGDEADIDKYTSFEQLQQAVQAASQKKTGQEKKKLIKAEGATVIHDDDNVTILVPHTKQAAQIYGSGTRWCISSTDGSQHFVGYRRDLAKHYFFLFKKRKPYNQRDNTGDVDYKMALTVWPDGRLDFRDSADASMSKDEWKRRSGYDADKFSAWDWKEMPAHEQWKVAKRGSVKFVDFVSSVSPETWDAIGQRANNLKQNWFASRKADAEKNGQPVPTDQQLEADWPDFWRTAKSDVITYGDDSDFLETLEYYISLIESRTGAWLANALLEGKFKRGDARAWFLTHKPSEQEYHAHMHSNPGEPPESDPANAAVNWPPYQPHYQAYADDQAPDQV